MRFSLAIALLALSATFAHADLAAIVHDAVQPHLDQHEIAGAAIAVARGNDTRFFYFGKTNLDTGGTPDESTLFEIGSITKTFTGTLLSLMVQDGTLKLDQAMQSLLPENVTLHPLGDRPITLVDIVTHSSGLPRMPGNWSPADGAAPYVDYDATKMYAFINDFKPTRAPGDKYEYSNFATALLGYSLAQKAGTEYEAVIRDRIWKPIGMDATHIHSSPAQLTKLATGYSSAKKLIGSGNKLSEQGRWDFDVFQSAGGIRSNIVDMAKYLHANMSPDESSLGRAMKAAQEPRFTVNEALSVGLNWHVLKQKDTGQVIVWHNGQTGGYHSFLGFNPARKEGVVYLSNANFDSDAIALEILKGLADLAEF